MAEKDEPRPMVTTRGLSRYIGVSEKTIYNWRSQGIGPAAYKVGGLLRWRLDEVDAWLSARTNSPAA